MKRDTLLILFLAAAASCSVLCLPKEAKAQVTTGTIVGEVRDAAAAIVPGVAVTAKNIDTGLVRQTTSSETGSYTFANLPVGAYEITAERSGFKTALIPNIVLQIDQSARVDITLIVGEVDETVRIEGNAALLKTESPDLGEVIEHKRVVDLPLNGRQLLQLALLSAGTSAFASGQSETFTGQLQPNMPLITVGGMREIDNNYTLDGVTMTDYWFGSLPIAPSVEAIQEFKVESNLSGAASAGFKAGAQINISTRSGSNDFHGSLFEFVRNDKFDARNFFDGPDKPPYRQNQFGFAFGGPIKTNKFFFFTNYEGLRVRQAITRTHSVPPQSLREGNFSGLAPIFDPATTDPVTGARQQFPGNIIPPERISPVSRALLDFLALPSRPGLSFNLVSTPRKRTDDNQFTIRVDRNFSSGDHAFARYTQAIAETFNPFSVSIFSVGAAPAPGYGSAVRNKVRNIALGHTHLFSPKLINNFRFGYNRIAGGFSEEHAGLDFCEQAGIQGCSRRPIDFAIPAVSTGIFSDFGDATVAPRRRENYFQWTDSMSYEYKRHTLSWGGELLWIHFNPLLAISPRGNFIFNPFYTASVRGGLNGNAFADFLLGLPRTAVIGRGDINANFRSLNKHFFFQDIWRARSNLTLNFGLRYEINPPPRDLNNRTANLDPRTFSFVVPVDENGRPNTEAFIPGIVAKLGGRITTAPEAGVPNALTRTNYLDFAPRVGLAYSPFDSQRTVIRLGYGIYFQQVTLNEIGRFAQNPPFFDINIVVNDISNPQPINTILTSAAAGAISGFTGDFDRPSPYVQQWTLSLQHQLGRNLIVEANYLGSKGTHLDVLYNLNQAIPGPGPVASRRPDQRIPSAFSHDTSSGSSSYHSMILRAEKRLSGGLFFVANYTLSKSIDNGSSILIGRAERILAQNTYDRSLEKGLSVFDRRHRFSLSYGYELPFGPGKRFLNNTGLSKLFEGWGIQGITTIYSGSHFTAILNQDRSGTGDRLDRPNQIADPNTGPGTPERFFNTGAFALQPQFTFGNAGRNTIVAPGYRSVDFSVIKNTILKERHALQLRMEIFNFFNHANFDLPNNITDSPDFGRIFTAQPSRQIQFGIKYVF